MTFFSALERVLKAQSEHKDAGREEIIIEYLYKSYPAENGDPRVGNRALSESRLMRRFARGVWATTADSACSSSSLRFLS